MTKTKTIILRQFDDCDKELQKKILDNYRYIETEWYDLLENEYYVNMLAEYGFNCSRKDIDYDISYCQGSGASFRCSDIDWSIVLKDMDLRHKKWWCEYLKDCGVSIKDNMSRYSHEMTKYIDTENCVLDYRGAEHDYPHLSREFDRILAYAEDRRLSACYKLYHDLEEEYEGLTSDEYVAETLRCNEYYFNERGEIDG